MRAFGRCVPLQRECCNVHLGGCEWRTGSWFLLERSSVALLLAEL